MLDDHQLTYFQPDAARSSCPLQSSGPTNNDFESVWCPRPLVKRRLPNPNIGKVFLTSEASPRHKSIVDASPKLSKSAFLHRVRSVDGFGTGGRFFPRTENVQPSPRCLVNANDDGRPIDPIVLHDVVICGSRPLPAVGARRHIHAVWRDVDIRSTDDLQEAPGGSRKGDPPPIGKTNSRFPDT